MELLGGLVHHDDRMYRTQDDVLGRIDAKAQVGGLCTLKYGVLPD